MLLPRHVNDNGNTMCISSRYWLGPPKLTWFVERSLVVEVNLAAVFSVCPSKLERNPPEYLPGALRPYPVKSRTKKVFGQLILFQTIRDRLRNHKLIRTNQRFLSWVPSTPTAQLAGNGETTTTLSPIPSSDVM